VIKGAITGGFEGAIAGAAFYGAGTLAINAGKAYQGAARAKATVARVVGTASHGIISGIKSEMKGSDFWNGFVSAAITKSLSPEISSIKDESLQTAGLAALGGTVSAIGGGKFVNGAVTFAYQHLLNDLAHQSTTSSVTGIAHQRIVVLDENGDVVEGMSHGPTSILGKIYGSGNKMGEFTPTAMRGSLKLM
jgi:hypothetical protein